MNNNKQLFSRMTVYVIVFVLVTVSYINFTNSKENALDDEPDVAIIDTTVKAAEAPESFDNLDDEMVLGEIDLDDFEPLEEVIESMKDTIDKN